MGLSSSRIKPLSIHSLCDDIIIHILRFLGATDSLHCSLLNKRWHALVDNDNLWENFIRSLPSYLRIADAQLQLKYSRARERYPALMAIAPWKSSAPLEIRTEWNGLVIVPITVICDTDVEREQRIMKLCTEDDDMSVSLMSVVSTRRVKHVKLKSRRRQLFPTSAIPSISLRFQTQPTVGYICFYDSVESFLRVKAYVETLAQEAQLPLECFIIRITNGNNDVNNSATSRSITIRDHSFFSDESFRDSFDTTKVQLWCQWLNENQPQMIRDSAPNRACAYPGRGYSRFISAGEIRENEMQSVIEETIPILIYRIFRRVQYYDAFEIGRVDEVM